MTRWWLGLPLIALGWAKGASAQTPPPSAPLATVPFNAFANEGGPNANPAGLGAPGAAYGGAPPGGYVPSAPQGGMAPMPGLDLSADPAVPSPENGEQKPNAFADPEAPSGQHGSWYFGVGFTGLLRQGLGHGVIAMLDPGNTIPGLPPNAHTGINPPNTAPTLLNFSDISPNFNWGTKATLGYRVGDDAFEVTGYYLGLSTAARAVGLPGQVDLPFSAFNAPLGFTGDNGQWLQADFAEAIQQTRVANAEFNYRHCIGGNVELIAGLRYMDVQERFSILTDDDGLELPSPNPFNQAIYSIATHNRIVAPQLGMAFEAPLAPWFSLSLEAKGAWGADFLSEDHLLLRGDGFVGPSSHTDHIGFSQIYEVALFANVNLGERVRVRAGYQALWVVDIPVASQQVDFDPNNPLANRDYRGSIFFHGPTVEIQFAF